MKCHAELYNWKILYMKFQRIDECFDRRKFDSVDWGKKQNIFGRTTPELSHIKWRCWVLSIYLHFMSKHLLFQMIRLSIFFCLALFSEQQRKKLCLSIGEKQSGIWYDIGSYENCINISSTITVARHNGVGFIRLLSLATTLINSLWALNSLALSLILWVSVLVLSQVQHKQHLNVVMDVPLKIPNMV